MEDIIKSNKKRDRQQKALERVRGLLSNKKHLPKKYRNENGNIKLSSEDFSKTRYIYEKELHVQIKVLEQRIKDAS